MAILHRRPPVFSVNNPAAGRLHRLSLHDALPISLDRRSLSGEVVVAKWTLGDHGGGAQGELGRRNRGVFGWVSDGDDDRRAEDGTSELRSPGEYLCRLLVEKKMDRIRTYWITITP